eukprot:7018183-Prymnesium_polylepis.1
MGYLYWIRTNASQSRDLGVGPQPDHVDRCGVDHRSWCAAQCDPARSGCRRGAVLCGAVRA